MCHDCHVPEQRIDFIQFLFSFSLLPWAAIYNTESNQKRRKSKWIDVLIQHYLFFFLLAVFKGQSNLPLSSHSQCALFYHTESTYFKINENAFSRPQILLIGAQTFCLDNRYNKDCFSFVIINMTGHKQLLVMSLLVPKYCFFVVRHLNVLTFAFHVTSRFLKF